MKSFALLRSLVCMFFLIALPLSLSINAQNISGIKMQRPSSTPAKSTTSKSTSKKASTSESRPKAKTSSEDREKHAEKSRPKASASSSSNKKSTPKLRVRKVSTPDDDDAERTVRSNVKAARSNNKEESPEAKRLNELNQQYNEASQAVAECDKKIADKERELKQGPSGALDDKVEDFIISLLNSRCNPRAIAHIGEFKNNVSLARWSDLEAQRDLLNNYSSYCHEIRNVLEEYHKDFKMSQWEKIEEGSEVLDLFDKQLKGISYFNHYKKRNNNIRFLDKCYDKIKEMQDKRFENCKDDYEKLITDLTPKSVDVTLPTASISTLKQDLETLKKQKENAQAQLSRITKEKEALEAKVNNNVAANDVAEVAKVNNQTEVDEEIDDDVEDEEKEDENKSEETFYPPAWGQQIDLEVAFEGKWQIGKQPESWGHCTIPNKNMVTYIADPNPSLEPRSDYFTIVAGDEVLTVHIIQNGRDAELTISSSYFELKPEGGTRYIDVDNEGKPWSIDSSSVSWAHLSKNGNRVTINVEPNTSSQDRTHSFNIISGDNSKKVEIMQYSSDSLN